MTKMTKMTKMTEIPRIVIAVTRKTLGEKVLTAFSENVLNPDKYSLTISTSTLSAGTYTIIFRTPTIVESYRLSVIK